MAAIRFWLASLFLYAGVSKALQWRTSVDAMVSLGIMPDITARAAGGILPGVEVCAGILLISSRFLRLGAGLAVGLGAAFAVGGQVALQGAAPVPCGCAGSGGDRVGRMTVARGATIAACATALTLSERSKGEQLPRLPLASALLGAAMPLVFFGCQVLVLRVRREANTAPS